MLQALGAVSENLSPFLLSVIQLSTDVHQACHVYLLEDGLELWLAVLENSSSMSYDLLQLFRNMPPLLGRFLKCNRSLLLSSHHFMPFELASLPPRILFVLALVRVLYDTWILWTYSMQSCCHGSCIIIYFNSIFYWSMRLGITMNFLEGSIFGTSCNHPNRHGMIYLWSYLWMSGIPNTHASSSRYWEYDFVLLSYWNIKILSVLYKVTDDFSSQHFQCRRWKCFTLAWEVPSFICYCYD